MLTKSFEPGELISPAVQFRGKDPYFWKRKFFKDIEPFEFPEGGTYLAEAREFHFLVIFNPTLFFVARPGTIEELITRLSSYDPVQAHIFSVAGFPFFIVSYGAFQSLARDLREKKEVISLLKESASLRLLSPGQREGIEILEIGRDLKAVESAVVDYQLAAFTASGVVIEDFNHFFVEGMIPIGQGTRISPGAVIKGESQVGQGVQIYPQVYIENSVIGNHCTLLPGSIVRDSVLHENVRIGPYTHLREGAVVKEGAKMGNFVEMKKSVLGPGSKAMHLTYIGDAEVGENVNIGAGTITCNYDGEKKHRTIIEDRVFIGSGTELVAPVVLRQDSYVGAGSTITEEVPRDALAVARQKQRNIPGWVTRKKRKKECKI